jgi:hypothetical protein
VVHHWEVQSDLTCGMVKPCTKCWHDIDPVMSSKEY